MEETFILLKFAIVTVITWAIANLDVESLALFFSVPQPVMAGTLAGTFIGAMARGSRVSRTTVWVRLLNIFGGFFFALYGTEGFVEILYHYLGIEPQPSSSRWVAMVVGLGGSLVVDLFFNFWTSMSTRGDDFATILVDAAKDSMKAVTVSIGRNKSSSDTVNPLESPADAPAVSPAPEEADNVCTQP